MSVTRAPGAEGIERLELRCRSGAIRLELREDGTFVFTWGRGTLQATSEEAGTAFVDAVANWLGFELRGENAAAASEALELFWARLGGGSDPFGARWESYKLSLALGER